MKVKVSEIREKMQRVLAKKGLDKKDIDFAIDVFLGGELRGHTSHGLTSFPGFARKELAKLNEPEVIKKTNSTIFIDANNNPGNIVGRRAADGAIEISEKEIVGTAIIKNMGSWLRPGAVAQYIADKGFFCIVINDGGGANMSPPGGYDPVLATNPIAYGIPADDNSLVVDLATSKRAMGQVRLANKFGKDLPSDSYYNDMGEVTLDPSEVHSVMPFGGYKGFVLALMIEILCGSLVGMDNMMLDDNGQSNNFGDKMPERGGFILVIDPSQTTDINVFKAANSHLLNRIKSTRNLEGEEIRIPGEKAAKLQNESINKDSIDIPEEVWEEIKSL